MANTIRDLAGLKYLEMQNGRFARKPITDVFASDTWTTIRVALRVDIVTGATFTPSSFFFGLCSGTTNIPGDATPTNAIGARTTPAVAWTFYNGGPSTHQCYGEMKPYKDVGGVQTAGTTFGSGSCAINCSTSSSASGAFFVTITRGSPNYTLDLFCTQPTQAAPCTPAQFATQSLANIPALTGYSNITAKALAFDQSAGTLDAAFIYWSDAILMRITEWRVIRLA